MNERNKRLRPDGNDQYLESKGQLSHYLDDPYVEVKEREPKKDHVTVVFIGGGYAGLVTGARLVEQGITDVRIMDKGGTLMVRDTGTAIRVPCVIRHHLSTCRCSKKPVICHLKNMHMHQKFWNIVSASASNTICTRTHCFIPTASAT
jgi:hypothetical protein